MVRSSVKCPMCGGKMDSGNLEEILKNKGKPYSAELNLALKGGFDKAILEVVICKTCHNIQLFLPEDVKYQ